ncbi:hypothetical protein OAL49_02305 [Gammaproteobacteria bacterium]|nr:hypothetical protein [Gammaproteobacteria bacterium]
MKKLSAFLVAGLLLEFGGYALRQETGLQLLPTLDSVAFAAEERKRRKARRVPNISEMTFRRLAQAQELMDLKEYDAALEVLIEMDKRSRRYNGNELGQVYSMFAFIMFSKEDNPRTIQYYEKVLEQGDDITEGLEHGTMYSLAQLYFVEAEYQRSLDMMNRWLIKKADFGEDPGPNPRYFMGQVYYAMKDYPGATKQIELAITMAEERNMVPIKENWWQLLRFLYFEQDNWDRVLEILHVLVRDYPKRDYWVQLAGIYGQEGYEREQVLAMEVAHAGGYLDRERDVLNYGGLLMQEEVPYRAAKWMQVGFDEELVEATAKNLQSLGQAYQIAQDIDDAIPILENAGQLSDEGEIFSRLSQLYLEKDEYKKCTDAADSALEKGVDREYNTEIVLGMCLFNRDRLTQARKTFVTARRHARADKNESVERICNQWITYIDRDRIRRDELAKAEAEFAG